VSAGAPIDAAEWRSLIDVTNALGNQLEGTVVLLATLLLPRRPDVAAIVAGFVPESNRMVVANAPFWEAVEVHPDAAEWMAQGAAMSRDELVELVHSVLDEIEMSGG
jgi:hypothetical protein